MLKMKCPANPDHKKFITVVHVSQDWVVDDQGNFIEIANDYGETVAGPNEGNTWTCKECGTEAVKVEEVMTPEKLAKKFVEAGNGDVAIMDDDLKAIGIENQDSFRPIGKKYPLKISGWGFFCQFIYEKLTDDAMPDCSLRGRGSRSRWHGNVVADAIREKFDLKE